MSWYKFYDGCQIVAAMSWCIVSACLAITLVGGVILGWVGR